MIVNLQLTTIKIGHFASVTVCVVDLVVVLTTGCYTREI